MSSLLLPCPLGAFAQNNDLNAAAAAALTADADAPVDAWVAPSGQAPQALSSLPPAPVHAHAVASGDLTITPRSALSYTSLHSGPSDVDVGASHRRLRVLFTDDSTTIQRLMGTWLRSEGPHLCRPRMT